MIGMLAAFCKPPRGWLALNGQAVKKAKYPELAKVVPYEWLQSNLIMLPEMAGRTLVGEGTNEAREFALGEYGGEHSHTLTVGEIPAHDHLIKAANSLGADPPPHAVAALDGTGEALNLSFPTGDDQPHENMPPFLVVRWCIYAGR